MAAAAFVPTVLAESSVTVNVAGNVNDPAFQETLRQLAYDALCLNHGTTCSVEFNYAMGSGRRLSNLLRGRQLSVTSGQITFTIKRDIFSTGGVEVTTGDGDGASEFGAGGSDSSGDKVGMDEALVPVFIGGTPSVLDTANPVVASFGTTLVSSLPSTYSPSSLVGPLRTASSALNGVGAFGAGPTVMASIIVGEMAAHIAIQLDPDLDRGLGCP